MISSAWNLAILCMALLSMLLLGAYGLLDGAYVLPMVFVGSIVGGVYSFWMQKWFPCAGFFIIAYLMYVAMQDFGGGGSLFNFKLPLPKRTRR